MRNADFGLRIGRRDERDRAMELTEAERRLLARLEKLSPNRYRRILVLLKCVCVASQLAFIGAFAWGIQKVCDSSEYIYRVATEGTGCEWIASSMGDTIWTVAIFAGVGALSVFLGARATLVLLWPDKLRQREAQLVLRLAVRLRELGELGGDAEKPTPLVGPEAPASG